MQLKLIILLLLIALSIPSFSEAQGCKDFGLREKITQVAKEKGVDEKELLSIVAHESSCHYYVIAWNLPKLPSTAQSKIFGSLGEAKVFGEKIITTGQYRVDVGIGQINNEAHIKPRGWTLGEVLDPKTALYRVAEVLKERGWASYHSSNQIYAKKWQALALAALDRALSNGKESSLKSSKAPPLKGKNPLIIFNGLANSTLQPIENNPVKIQIIQKKPLLLVFDTKDSTPGKTNPSWIVYGSL